MIDFSKIKEMDFTSVEVYEPTRVDGTFIEHFRNKHNLTQYALANIMGVSYKTILRWERRKKPIKGSAAVLLSLLNDNDELVESVYRVKHYKEAEQGESENCDHNSTGVGKLKLSLAREMIVKNGSLRYYECEAKPVDNLVCTATVSIDEMNYTPRVLYLVSRLYGKLIGAIAENGVYVKGGEQSQDGK